MPAAVQVAPLDEAAGRKALWPKEGIRYGTQLSTELACRHGFFCSRYLALHFSRMTNVCGGGLLSRDLVTAAWDLAEYCSSRLHTVVSAASYLVAYAAADST